MLTWLIVVPAILTLPATIAGGGVTIGEGRLPTAGEKVKALLLRQHSLEGRFQVTGLA